MSRVSVRDPTATPSSWRRVDGVETRRHDLMHAPLLTLLPVPPLVVEAVGTGRPDLARGPVLVDLLPQFFDGRHGVLLEHLHQEPRFTKSNVRLRAA